MDSEPTNIATAGTNSQQAARVTLLNGIVCGVPRCGERAILRNECTPTLITFAQNSSDRRERPEFNERGVTFWRLALKTTARLGLR